MRELELRNGTAEDADFLYGLHKAALRNYVEKTWGWDEAFQRAYFLDQFDASRCKLVYRGGAPIGCIRQRLHPDVLELEYIALLPDYQRRGIGTFLIREVLSEARVRRLPVRLRILKVNPARSLYERLGFVVSGEDAHRYYMELQPPV